MKMTIVVDNLSCRQSLLSEWGYSALLETPTGNVLLDTGEHGDILMHNLRELHIRPERINHIILSHGHFDHCGGLGELLKHAPQATLWGAPQISIRRGTGADPTQAFAQGGGALLQIPMTSVKDAATVMPGVIAFDVPQEERNLTFVHQKNMWEAAPDGSFRPDSFADDLSLLIEGVYGYSLLLGCAHAGLPNILCHIRKRFGISSLYAVIGGMHLAPVAPEKMDQWIQALRVVEVQCWRPNHCTGFRAAAKLAAFFEDVDWAGAGTRMEL